MHSVPQIRMQDPETASGPLQRQYIPTPFALGKFRCSICGQPISQLSSDPKESQYEAKWKVHAECRDQLLNMMDRQTDVGGRRRI